MKTISRTIEDGLTEGPWSNVQRIKYPQTAVTRNVRDGRLSFFKVRGPEIRTVVVNFRRFTYTHPGRTNHLPFDGVRTSFIPEGRYLNLDLDFMV